MTCNLSGLLSLFCILAAQMYSFSLLKRQVCCWTCFKLIMGGFFGKCDDKSLPRKDNFSDAKYSACGGAWM